MYLTRGRPVAPVGRPGRRGEVGLTAILARRRHSALAPHQPPTVRSDIADCRRQAAAQRGKAAMATAAHLVVSCKIVWGGGAECGIITRMAHQSRCTPPPCRARKTRRPPRRSIFKPTLAHTPPCPWPPPCRPLPSHIRRPRCWRRCSGKSGARYGARGRSAVRWTASVTAAPCTRSPPPQSGHDGGPALPPMQPQLLQVRGRAGGGRPDV